MTWVVPLALGGVAILLMAVFTVLSARKRHRAIAAPATTVGPRILVHDINDDRCTGCDACVAVCPTNVLDLVSNKSRVLRFHDCIQCEACMFACPTEALVMFPQGGVPPSLKVPEIDENFQTAVPGQYLIGEVAGKPLVKNAANLGRAVVEHMLATGLAAGALGRGDNTVDVAIIGSGPGGLSAALTCIQRGLSYVVLEKEQMIASTIARYPKGKLVMAEPYDTLNMSFLPVFDSGKEQLIPIWKELIDRVGLVIKQGESVETVTRGGDGVFEVRSTVATYRAQRAVLSIGTRGKPRTLQVPGENLPKVYSLLEDPDDWRGKSVLVVGGGDSACEAALALADAGAKVMISYRGKGFNRAAPKNKQAIEGYAAQGKVKSKLGSQVVNFEPDALTLALADGSQKRYPNDATFVLIGADPPIAWLEKMGVKFVERPHQYQLGKTDDIVRKLVGHAVECPEDAARAAAQVLGGSIAVEPAPPLAPPGPALPMPMGEPVSGPRKWLRSATSIFSSSGPSGASGPGPGRLATNPGVVAQPSAGGPRGARAKKFDAPVPLSEFARRGKSGTHSHNGRRDALSAGERTRILRMLRDEGGRMADEESHVYIGAAPGGLDDLDLDDAPAPPPVHAEVLARSAQAGRASEKRTSAIRAAARPGGQSPRPALEPGVTAPEFAAPRAQPQRLQADPGSHQGSSAPLHLSSSQDAAPLHLPSSPGFPAPDQLPVPQAPLHLSPQDDVAPLYLPASQAYAAPSPPPPGVPAPDPLLASHAHPSPLHRSPGHLSPAQPARSPGHVPSPGHPAPSPSSPGHLPSRPPSSGHPAPGHLLQSNPPPSPAPPAHPVLPQAHPPPPQAHSPASAPPRSRPRTVQPPPGPRRPVPAFNEEPTRQVDDAMLDALRLSSESSRGSRGEPGSPPGPAPAKATSRPPQNAASAGRSAPNGSRPAAEAPVGLPAEPSTTGWPGRPQPAPIRAAPDEPTRMARVDQLGFAAPVALDGPTERLDGSEGPDGDEMTRPAEDFAARLRAPVAPGELDDRDDPDEATRLASLDAIAALERARASGQATDERTRSVNIRHDPSMSDIDWDLD